MEGGEVLAFDEEVDRSRGGTGSGEAGGKRFVGEDQAGAIGLAVEPAFGMRLELQLFYPVAGVRGFRVHGKRVSQCWPALLFRLECRGPSQRTNRVAQDDNSDF